MSVQEAGYAYVGAFIDELSCAGVRHVCICPGSRSTPLAMLCAANPDLRVWMHIDERSAAFFALGLARATRTPVALVATSGTAVVNFMPAVVEAFYSRVPLLLLTADRPPELRDVGTNQTIDQVRLYGSHVKWSVDMPLPEATETMVRYARVTASRAAATAQAAPAGPVHLNFPLREPLVPADGPAARAIRIRRENIAMSGLAGADGSGAASAREAVPDAGGSRTNAGLPGNVPYTIVVDGPRALSSADAVALASQWGGVEKGLIVCGPETPEDAAALIARLAAALGWPVLADPLSGLRAMPSSLGTVSALGAQSHPDVVVDAYDVFLRADDVAAALRPELIVRFGALPVSKPLMRFLERYRDVPQVIVDDGAGWRDPALAAAAMLYVDPKALCRSVLDAMTTEARHHGGVSTRAGGNGSAWLSLWLRLNGAARKALRRASSAQPDMFEGRVFEELAALLPDGATLYVGNSMPVRDMDAFFPVIDRNVRVFGNRGASGIDGVVSSALGAAAGTDGPTVLVLGDLSFYHDLNGLLAAKLHRLDVTIVLINNDGGGIFSFLPQAEHPKHFELLFGTPIGLDFEPVVRMYGGRFVRVRNWEEFRRAVARGVESEGLHVVEVATDRARNVRQHGEVFAAARAAVSGVLRESAAVGAVRESSAGTSPVERMTTAGISLGKRMTTDGDGR